MKLWKIQLKDVDNRMVRGDDKKDALLAKFVPQIM